MAADTSLASFVAFIQAKAVEFARYPWRRPLAKIRLSFISATKQNFQSGKSPLGDPWLRLKFPRPRSGGDKPLYRYGLLMQSVTGQGKDHIHHVTDRSFEIGTNQRHAGIHQYGGTIRPTKASWLAIPLTAKAFTAGSPRRFPGKLRWVEVIEGRKAFWVEDRTDKRGRRLPPIYHYVLVKRVKITARPFLGWNDRMILKAQVILLDDVVNWLTR